MLLAPFIVQSLGTNSKRRRHQRRPSLDMTNTTNGITSSFFASSFDENSKYKAGTTQECISSDLPVSLPIDKMKQEQAPLVKNLIIDTSNVDISSFPEIENCIDDPTLAPLGAHISPVVARFNQSQSSRLSSHSRTHKQYDCQFHMHSQETASLILHRRQMTSPDFAIHVSGLSVTTLSALVSVDLSRNHLSHLPTEFTQLTLNTLLHLNLSCNRLSDFPDLSGFPNLRTLNLSQNCLQGLLPDHMPLKNPHLTYLNLSTNAITCLPTSIKYWNSLETLILGSAIYGGNQLTAFPPDTIPFLHSLIELDLSHNLFFTIPSDLAHPHSRLLHLSMANNKVTYLPASLPRTLKTLNLHRNQISSLPCWITELKALETLDLSENLLCILPAEIISFIKGRTAVLTGNPFTRPGYCDLSEKELMKELLRRGVMRKVVAYETPRESGYLDSEPERSEEECMDGIVLMAIGGEKSRPGTPLGVSGVSTPPLFSSEEDLHIPLPNPFPALPMSIARKKSGSRLTTPSVDSPAPSLGSPTIPFVNDIDDATIPTTLSTSSKPVVNCTPGHFIPSLVELCARQLLTLPASTLPTHLVPEKLLDYLSTGPHKCEEGCGRIFVREYVAGMQIRSTGYGGVLIRGKFCTGECWRKWRATDKTEDAEEAIVVQENEMCLMKMEGDKREGTKVELD